MLKRDFHIIGLMSGTSLDGVDLVYVRFNQGDRYTFEIQNAITVSYEPEWRAKLTEAYANGQDLDILTKDYGAYLGGLINAFRKEYGISEVDFVASHGHTIFHKPDQGFTLQIGDGPTISEATKLPVICDFRTQDVALGGQGAPLVPIGDLLLFSTYDYCLNLGGFANVSFQEGPLRIAYDICPVNIVLNSYAQRLGYPFDDKGQISRQGELNTSLLEALNALTFYSAKPPKSLGLEWVESEIIPILEETSIDDRDVLRTFTEHIAQQIGRQFTKEKASVLITGGGAFNEFLLSRIRAYSKAEIHLPTSDVIEYKEAVVFAFLGLLKFHDRINVLKSVTGASKDHAAGKIFSPIV